MMTGSNAITGIPLRSPGCSPGGARPGCSPGGAESSSAHTELSEGDLPTLEIISSILPFCQQATSFSVCRATGADRRCQGESLLCVHQTSFLSLTQWNRLQKWVRVSQPQPTQQWIQKTNNQNRNRKQNLLPKRQNGILEIRF